MAFASKVYTLDQAVHLCLQTDNEEDKDADSSTGGMSSGEEEELDHLLMNDCDNDQELRLDASMFTPKRHAVYPYITISDLLRHQYISIYTSL